MNIRERGLDVDDHVGVVLLVEDLQRALEHLGVTRVALQQPLDQGGRPAKVVGLQQPVDGGEQDLLGLHRLARLRHHLGVELGDVGPPAALREHLLQQPARRLDVPALEVGARRRDLQFEATLGRRECLPGQLRRLRRASSGDQRIHARGDEVAPDSGLRSSARW